MNQCYSCNTCQSADKAIEGYIRSLPMETSHHRVDGQSVKCGFGLQGVCCRLCSNGPCRITPEAPRGICGATGDVIVARNFLRAIASGSGCYIHVVENTALELKNVALNGGNIKSIPALDHLCKKMDIDTNQDPHKKALAVAQAVLDDIYRPAYEPMQLTEKIAYPKRFDKWKALGLLPGGANAEIVKGVVKCSTNLSSDPVDMLLTCLKLGISTGIYGLTLTNLLNDIMLGQPEIRIAPVGLNVIDTDYINIMITGHQHSIFSHLQDQLITPAAIAKANAVGAKGFKLVGCTCVGQDLQLRGAHYTEVFDGHAGNNYVSEAVLATGAIDAVLSEFNCTLPGIEPICDQLQILQICLDDVAKKANAIYMPYNYATKEADSLSIMDKIVEAYQTRRSQVPLNLLPDHGNKNTLTGVSEGSLKAFLGGTFQPLIDLIAAGEIKGIAAVVGCSNLTFGGHDMLSVDLTKELIQRDMIVLTAGCSSGGIENCGLMTPEAAQFASPKLRAVCEKLGIPPVLNFGPCLAIGRLELVAAELAAALSIDIPQLPLVLSAPQWLEEQAIADGAFGLALGLPLHLGEAPFTSGSALVTKVLTEDLVNITGGRLIVDNNATSAADTLEAIIMEKRKALGL